MLKLTTENMARAIEKAKADSLKVKVISVSERRYAVTGTSGHTYNVRFAVVNGVRFGECDCPARTYCKHLAGAAAVNIGIQSQRAANPTNVEMFAFERTQAPYGCGYLL